MVIPIGAAAAPVLGSVKNNLNEILEKKNLRTLMLPKYYEREGKSVTKRSKAKANSSGGNSLRVIYFEFIDILIHNYYDKIGIWGGGGSKNLFKGKITINIII